MVCFVHITLYTDGVMELTCPVGHIPPLDMTNTK